MSNLDTPLADVTFVVLDLETTGGAPGHDRITEIGALKVRGGELLGHVDTLVNPGVPIPPEITLLTGITEAMVFPAPPIEELLPSLLEFLHGTVIVGHNVRFDCGFLDAALSANGYPLLANLRVDTLALARRLVCDELPNLRLGTLADHFRTTTVPAHRAYADADATTDLLHTAARTRGRLRRARTRRSPRDAEHPTAPDIGQARPHRAPAARARRVLVPRPSRPRAVRRNRDRRAGTGSRALLRRHSPRGTSVAARGRAGRPPRVWRPDRSEGTRTTSDPAARTALQPPDAARGGGTRISASRA